MQAVSISHDGERRNRGGRCNRGLLRNMHGGRSLAESGTFRPFELGTELSDFLPELLGCVERSTDDDPISLCVLFFQRGIVLFCLVPYRALPVRSCRQPPPRAEYRPPKLAQARPPLPRLFSEPSLDL